MNKHTVVIYLSFFLTISTSSAQITSTSDRVDVHVAAAKAAAKNDLAWHYQSACRRVDAALAGQDVGRGGGDDEEGEFEWDQYLPPTKVFDNLYFVGNKHMSTWALTTSEGIIIIDAMYETSVQKYVVEGLRELGLDPADIKYVIPTHGHHDHYGGAHYLQKQFGARVVMAAGDWDLMLNDPEENIKTQGKPTRDIVAEDGQKITLGDTTVTLVLTPGHTKGVISMIVPVKEQGEQHMAIVRGSGGNTQESLDDFIKFANLATQAKADIVLSYHPGASHTLENLDAFKKRKSGEPNPFVLGTDAINRYTQIVIECATANLLNR